MNSLRYATKVWLTGVLISPFIYLLICKSLYTQKYSFIGLEDFILFSIILGMIFSIPSWLGLFFTVKLLNKKSISILNKKILVSLISIILTLLPFYFVFFKNIGFQFPDLMLFATYVSITTISVFFYKIKLDNVSYLN